MRLRQQFPERPGELRLLAVGADEVEVLPRVAHRVEERVVEGVDRRVVVGRRHRAVRRTLVGWAVYLDRVHDQLPGLDPPAQVAEEHERPVLAVRVLAVGAVAGEHD